MSIQSAASINCPNCGTPFTAPVQQIFDTQENPEVKYRLLTGQMNSIICPHCGFQGALNSPFLYHDPEFEIAFVYVPMDLGATDVDQQKVIGDLTKRLMDRLPPEARKGYLLQPRTFFTVQSLLDAVLEKDEETREVVEAQRRKAELLEGLRQMDPEDSLAVAEFVGANDEELDETFFQILGALIGMAENQGNAAERDLLMQHQANLMEKSTTGRSIKAQRAAVEALSANPTRETLIEQLIAAEGEAVREALLVVGRQLLDYIFFQTLTRRIDAAEDAATREALIALRKEVLEIRDKLDDMARAMLDSRAELLRDLMVADDPREIALRHLPELDAIFLDVLNANIYQAEQEGREDVVLRLRRVGDMVINLLEELAPPEVRLINRLIVAEDHEQVDQLLEAEREGLDDDFVETVERAAQDLQQEGRQQDAERLRYAAGRIKELIRA